MTFDSEGARAHISGMQTTVARLAANSAQCKTWTVTLITALLALTVEKKITAAMPVTLVPILLFGFLDAYYLQLERRVRNNYIAFVDALRNSAHPGAALNSPEALIFKYGNTQTDASFSACLKSPSVWLFYIGLLVVTTAAQTLTLLLIPQ